MTISDRAIDTQTSSRMVMLYISDHAYNFIAQQARLAGFSQSTEVARGIGKYIEYLMTCDMADTRPDDIRASDADFLSAGMSPEWRVHGPRMARRVKLSEQALISACAHAIALGMAFPPARRITGAPTFYDDVQCMSSLLEAIGTEWVDVTARQE